MWLFIQHCILPRATFSCVDALYCAKFVDLLHDLNVPYFNTLLYYFRLFNAMPAVLMSCTELEARRIARFLQV